MPGAGNTGESVLAGIAELHSVLTDFKIDHQGASAADGFSIAHSKQIAEEKQAEEALRESEEKFRIAFENAPTGMSIIDADGRTYLAVNPLLCQMFGYTWEEFMGASVNLVTHPDDVERSNEWIRKKYQGEPCEQNFEKRYIHKDGHIVWGLVRAQWIKNRDGSNRMAVAHILDITARKQAEESLRERERQLREAHEIALMGHWQLHLNDSSMTWSAGICRLFEVEGVQATYEAFETFIHPDDREMVAAAHRSTLEQGQRSDLVHRLLLAQGRIKHVRRISRPEYDAKGKLTSIVGVLQDVSSIRQAEEERATLETQLHQAQKMEAIGYLAGGIAHDFNNLLTVIGGNAALAIVDSDPQAPQTALLREISQAVESASNLTRQLLAFSRRQVIAPKVLNLNDVVRHLSKMIERLLGEDLELKTMMDPALGQVCIDPGQAEQIFVNLAINARDAMSDGGKLNIETANAVLSDEYCASRAPLKPGDYVMLAVSDNGAGMTDETKARLFEPFFTTKESGKGTGLGLATIYGVVRQNKGHIDVTSELQQGTTFKIYLPRVNEPAQGFALAQKRAWTRGHETILFVEDNPMVRSLGVRTLIRQGYKVHAFSSGDEALAAFQHVDDVIHLIVTDVVLPGMNGRVFAEQIKAMRGEIKVLFTSGYTQNVIHHHGVLEEGIEFLAKPYMPEVLVQRVRDVLDGAK